MNKLGTKLGAIAMSAVMALSFAPSAAITSLAASGDDLLDATFGVEPVYRLYNPNSGEHLFTTDVLERDSLVKENWDNEGAKWNAPSVSAEGIYRLYNPSTGEHLYTSDGLEIAHLVNDEKWEEDFGGYPAFYAADDDLDPDAITINRFFNPAGTGVSAHIFSADPAEIKALTDKGYEKENGFGGYPLDYEPEEPVEELTVSIDNPTPKVGDTLTAEVVDRNGKDVSDNVTFQWYADDEKLDGETDETLDVTIGMIGSTIKVVVTAENGNTFSSDPTAKVDDGVYTFEIESAEATKVSEITVTFAYAVDAENVTFKVTKGTADFSIEGTPVWEDKDKAVLTMSANLNEGTYTVTATDSVTKDTDSYEFEVEKQDAAKIVILNKTALTSKDKKEAYAYYDILDQYNQSMRTSASIQWSGSCDIKADKATGKLTLTKHATEDDWVYNEQIYITGVYVKKGVAKSEALTVGTEQNLNSIEMVGFLKKGTSDIIKPDKGLPEDFKTGEYYLLFNALDQNGCPLDAEDITKEDVTFISTDPLVVKELIDFEPNGLTVKGTEYCAVFIEPGINVSKGGEVTVTAIANKTGNKDVLNFIVGPDPVPVTFKLGSPTVTVADGDQGVVIPFEALDQDLKPITNFRALAKQEIFNKLSFTSSEGKLKLAETDTGKAELTWSDDAAYNNVNPGQNNVWKKSTSTDDIDRPISLTVVVVGGDSNNEMIYVQDKRRPNSIDSVNLKNVLVEGATATFSLNSFRYKDQYGDIIGDADEWGADNGFFAASARGYLNGIDYGDYTFGVKVEYAGTGYMHLTNATTDVLSGTWVDHDDDPETEDVLFPDGKKAVVSYDVDRGASTNVEYTSTTDIQSAATGEGFKFSISKFKQTDKNSWVKPDDWDAVSPNKFHDLTIVDITKVQQLQIAELKQIYAGELNITGDKIIGAEYLDDLKATTPETEVTGVRGGVQTDQNYQVAVKVSGKYGSSDVDIPAKYFEVTTTKGSLTSSNKAGKSGSTAVDGAKIDGIGTIKITDLYNRTTANGNTKPGEDEVKATVYKLYSDESTTNGYWKLDAADGKWKPDTTVFDADTANTNITNARNGALAQRQVTLINEMVGDGTVTVGTLNTFLTNAPYSQNTVAEAQSNLAEAQTNLAMAQTTLTSAKNNLTKKNKDVTDAQGEVEEATQADALAAQRLQGAEGAYKVVDTVESGSTVQPYNNAKDATDAEVVTPAAGSDPAVTLTDVCDDLWDTKKADWMNDPTTAKASGIAVAIAGEDSIDGTSHTTWPTLAQTYLEKKLDYEVAKKATGDAVLAKAETAQTLDEKSQALTNAQTAAATAAEAVTGAEGAVAGAEQAVHDAEEDLKNAGKDEAVDAANALGAVLDAEIATKKAENLAGGATIYATYDSVKRAITYSDQAPYAADITNLAESYTFHPTTTKVRVTTGIAEKKALGIVDQYGVTFGGVLEYTVSNVKESEDGYAENNFKVTNNGQNTASIEGAELGDTFDLTISVKDETLKKTTKVTIGADKMASIEESTNNYLDTLKKELEKQRQAGLQ